MSTALDCSDSVSQCTDGGRAEIVLSGTMSLALRALSGPGVAESGITNPSEHVCNSEAASVIRIHAFFICKPKFEEAQFNHLY